jgi:SAM-dependent methyltransferase
MAEWWQTFFDDNYLMIAGNLLGEEASQKQVADLWSMLDLREGCRILDAPCGWGRLSRHFAARGAVVLGVDQSETMLAAAEQRRGDLPPDRLEYRRHDLRTPLDRSDFDVACNIFTSFGYGTEEDDLAVFRTLRNAVRPGGRVVVETNHRDLMCAYIARGSKFTLRMPDGTLFMDDPDFDSLSGVVTLNWYWSGPGGAGEKHARWRCYTPTEILRLLQRAGLSITGAYSGLTKTPFAAVGPEVGGRLAVVARRED